MRSEVRRLAAVVVAASFLAACGGGDGPATLRTLSCNFPGAYCDTLSATLTDTQAAELRATCTRSGGTFDLNACSPNNMLAGTCQYDHPATVALGFDYTDALLVEWYDGLAYDATTAQAACAAAPAGTWVP